VPVIEPHDVEAAAARIEGVAHRTPVLTSRSLDAAAGAERVLCLAFPVHPPGRPEKSRLSELDGVGVPVLVVQGEGDPFGMPPPAPGRRVVALPGNHGLKGDLPALAAAVREFLAA
jgi:hypothetical protein